VLVECDLQSNTVAVFLCTDDNRTCVDPQDSRYAYLDKLKTIQQFKLPSGIRLKEPANLFASLNLSSSKKFVNISRPHFRFSREGYPVDAATSQGDLMRGSLAISPGNTSEDKLVFISAGGNVKIRKPVTSDGELKNE
jgi:hypothetical protein